MANCPKCTTRTLSPTLLAAGLSAKGCLSCNGVLIDLLSYRAWADQKGIDVIDNVADETAHIADTSQAISCPSCSSVMSKFRISKTGSNRLDCCLNCDRAWLDGGEWELLNSLGLRKNLGTVFTEPWQRKIRSAMTKQVREDILRERFGTDFERIKEFRSRVQEHPQFESVTAWIGDRDED